MHRTSLGKNNLISSQYKEVNKMKRITFKDQSGFTLIEMLIVVLLLGILAMLIVPQISVSTADANLNTLQSNLGALRNAIELYYHQHNQVYAGVVDVDGSTATTNATAPNASVRQLTEFTDINGHAQVNRDATHVYGPYLKATSLPTNPFNSMNTLACDISVTDITARALIVPETAWAYHPSLGVFFANDAGGHNNL
jgi:prepilin-type N-terminal cleavage/methylation domain-containing protein